MRKYKNTTLTAFDKKAGSKNRIHFLNTSFSDAILLESEGKFALNCLKVGHHSYAGSTSSVWLRKLKPEVCIVTNDYKTADKITLRRIRRIAKSDIFLTGEENGIVAVIDNNGKINYYNDIHK